MAILGDDMKIGIVGCAGREGYRFEGVADHVGRDTAEFDALLSTFDVWADLAPLQDATES